MVFERWRLIPKMYNAVKMGDVKRVEELLEQGIDPDTTFTVGGGLIPVLCVAAEHGFSNIIQLLCSHHCSTAQLDQNGLSPLHIASARGFIDVVQVLIKNRAEINRAAETSVQETPLLMACNTNMTGTITLLIRSGADVNRRNRNGTTPLMSAAEQGNVEAVKLLIQAGADIHARDCDGGTPLHRHATSMRLKPELIKILCPTPEMANIVNLQGSTALMLVICNPIHDIWKLEVLECLIKMKCDVNAVTMVGASALHLTCYLEQWTHARLLIRVGARSDIPDILGRTALFMVLDKKKFSVAELMLASGNPCQLLDWELNKLKDNAGEYIKAAKSTVRSLKYSCRIAVRRSWGDELEKNLEKACLPATLKEYIRGLELDRPN